MKNMKLIALFVALLFCGIAQAQTKEYCILLSKALNELMADMPNDCTNLYSKGDQMYALSYISKVSFPNSIENAFLNNTTYHVLFSSYVAAGNDKAAAIIKLNEMGKAILATTVQYSSKNYKIKYLSAEPTIDGMPQLKYELENGAEDLSNIKLYVRLENNLVVDGKNKFKIELSVYRKKDNSDVVSKDECIMGDCENGPGMIEYGTGDSYEGDFKDGRAHGQGKYFTKDGAVYTGSFKNDKYNGFGTLVSPKGDKHEGNFVDGKKDGHGKFTYANGDVIEGIYSAGKIKTGIYTTTNGTFYDGEWENGKMNGQGKFHNKVSNVILEGEFKDGAFVKGSKKAAEKSTATQGCITGDCKNGKGRIIFNNGEKYEGDFRDGQPDGQGVYTQTNGAKYTGTLKKGKYNGTGAFVEANGSIAQGNFVENKLNGKGKFTNAATGHILDGIFSNGIFVKGLYTWPDGSYYDGQWENSKMNGVGKYFNQSENKTIAGIFKDNELIEYAKDSTENAETVAGCVTGDCRNGKGRIELSNGDKYEGDFKNGIIEGQGQFTRANGSKYTGKLTNGKFNGFGTLVDARGNIATGNYVDNELDGQGKRTFFQTGDIYEGLFSNGYFNKGRYTWRNGNYYEGEWKKFKMNGLGKFYNATTKIFQEGTFKDDEFVK
jgi:hypothetical protein